MPVPVAVRSKEWVYDRSPAAIVSSNWTFGGSLGSVLESNPGDPGSIPGSVIGDFDLSLILCRLYVVVVVGIRVVVGSMS